LHKRHYTFAAAGGICLQRFRSGTAEHRPRSEFEAPASKLGSKALIFRHFSELKLQDGKAAVSFVAKRVLLPSSIG
jgi:hypothetical protein